ncbi:vacuolar ATP synthase subunit D, putative [Cryptosporidium muris RN66]|uniref:Vacuolar ATP synthase subunit D, putative n=1 Tax=Cryptosporidium muris (strain RN66) TaxID=441375 RepID=B6AA27_CRYMR|nr:vacuolar ATP synthase subunit D, putative [Cryptosporidium muris RN66]EEA05068.1 vacuolar ATP synthase subunit D, putative [Cryptosporidium muris RN66]|eukprot:XP_002139417.1 vacuolar ATP synthase subunit D [Cryptosporidium muris RN66]
MEQRPTPSRMNLQAIKQKSKGAKQGYDLLKRKSDALTNKFRGMLKEIVETKRLIGDEMKEASFALAKATWAAGDFKDRIIESCKKPAISLDVATENIAGVRLPIFELNIDTSVDVTGHIGVASGGQVIQSTKDIYLRVLKGLVKLASLQTAFFSLDEEIKMTNRRVNALQNVVLPKLDDGINYILKELDEIEREEFFRLKKIQEKKKEWAEAEALGRASRKEECQSEIDDPESVFGQKDEGILF